MIPRIIYSDAYASEMVAYADLILPDTTYMERHDCISLLDRPISEPEAAGDAIRWPVTEPDRDVRGFQSVLIDLGARLGLPGFVDAEGKALYADYADYIVSHQRRPGVGPLMGFRGQWRGCGAGRAQSGATGRAISPMAGSSRRMCRTRPPITSRGTPPIRTGRWRWAFTKRRSPICSASTPSRCAGSSWRPRGMAIRSRPTRLRARLKQAMDPLPVWYPPFGDDGADGYPLHALTQRPMAMYHSWGSQNAWLRQITGRNLLYVPTKVWVEQGFAEGDWARVTSPTGEIVVPVAHMAALNENTVWTWNAIGKRKGAWALDADAPEAVKGFLLNHLISELLPEKGDGMRWSNSDPVTGQAAWFDLRVRIEKVGRAGRGTAAFGVLGDPRDAGTIFLRKIGCLTREVRHDLSARTCRKEAGAGDRPGHLRRLPCLRDGLQGLERSGLWRAAVGSGRLWRRSVGDVPEPGAHLSRCSPRTGRRRSSTSPGPACIARMRPASPSAPPGRATSGPRTGSCLVNEDACIGCGLCAWACPYGARELDAAAGVMKKCTLCVDRIYNENLPEEDREPACVRTCPTGARHFGDLSRPRQRGEPAGGRARGV